MSRPSDAGPRVRYFGTWLGDQVDALGAGGQADSHLPTAKSSRQASAALGRRTRRLFRVEAGGEAGPLDLGGEGEQLLERDVLVEAGAGARSTSPRRPVAGAQVGEQVAARADAQGGRDRGLGAGTAPSARAVVSTSTPGAASTSLRSNAVRTAVSAIAGSSVAVRPPISWPPRRRRRRCPGRGRRGPARAEKTGKRRGGGGGERGGEGAARAACERHGGGLRRRRRKAIKINHQIPTPQAPPPFAPLGPSPHPHHNFGKPEAPHGPASPQKTGKRPTPPPFYSNAHAPLWSSPPPGPPAPGPTHPPPRPHQNPTPQPPPRSRRPPPSAKGPPPLLTRPPPTASSPAAPQVHHTQQPPPHQRRPPRRPPRPAPPNSRSRPRWTRPPARPDPP